MHNEVSFMCIINFICVYYQLEMISFFGEGGAELGFESGLARQALYHLSHSASPEIISLCLGFWFCNGNALHFHASLLGEDFVRNKLLCRKHLIFG
jgi:hypothetical protein